MFSIFTSISSLVNYLSAGVLRYNFRDGFLDFLKAASADKEGYPNSLDILLKEGGVKLVLSNKDDPDDAGFVQWRTARPAKFTKRLRRLT